MLQQTRVAAVVEKYDEFLRRFPDVSALAEATLDDVLASWSGLGYYRRARALHAAAQAVVREGMPKTSIGWRALPGIGAYTSAAIASIAFGEPAASVDGNVERVLARLSGKFLLRNQAEKLAASLLSPRRPGDFNQAMMELGALVCTPRSPKCDTCPVTRTCATRGEHPVAKPKPRLKRKLAYTLAQRGQSVKLVKRGATESLMPGMWELPSATGADAGELLFSVRHSITIADYTIEVFKAKSRGGTWIPFHQLNTLPLTGLTRKILRRAGLLTSSTKFNSHATRGV